MEAALVAPNAQAILRRIGFEGRAVVSALMDPRAAPWSQLVFLACASYLVLPIDFIPASVPIFGHADEAGFLLAGIVAARALAPSIPRPGALAPGLMERLQFRLRVLQADFSNFYLLQHRREDGFLITGKNSGSHWLKFLLNTAFAEQFGVAPPPHATGPGADYIVGRGGNPKPFGQLPHIATSHTIISGFFALPFAFRLVPKRPIVVMVRDIGEAMRSNYVKWHGQYDGSLQTYVWGDPTGRRHISDAWWYVHFFNRWGDVARAHPGLVLLVRYEDLRADPATWLRRIALHYGIDLTQQAVAAALCFVDRESIRARHDPNHAEIIVPDTASRAGIAFMPADQALLDGILRRHLRHHLA